MTNWLKTSHRRHSGHLRPHEFTSYPSLFVLLFFVGFALTFCTALAKTPYDGPESGSVGISGTMPGPPPTVAAVINSPTNGQSFSTSPVTVSGTCQKETLVEIFKNGIFAGSGACSTNGSFSFDVDLMNGRNKLTARDYDALNQPGPDSAAVSVTYNQSSPAASSIAPLSLSGAQLLVNTDAVYRGIFPGQTLSVPINILGGSPPYAVNVEWGDTKNQVISRSNGLSFSATHAYAKAGTYQITIQVTDSQSRVAFLTVVAVVNGQPSVLGSASGSSGGQQSATSKLVVLWPLYTTSAAVVVSFWLGERREKHIMGPSYTYRA